MRASIKAKLFATHSTSPYKLSSFSVHGLIRNFERQNMKGISGKFAA